MFPSDFIEPADGNIYVLIRSQRLQAQGEQQFKLHTKGKNKLNPPSSASFKESIKKAETYLIMTFYRLAGLRKLAGASVGLKNRWGSIKSQRIGHICFSFSSMAMATVLEDRGKVLRLKAALCGNDFVGSLEDRSMPPWCLTGPQINSNLQFLNVLGG